MGNNESAPNINKPRLEEALLIYTIPTYLLAAIDVYIIFIPTNLSSNISIL
jgi:hypothetical protein